MALTVSVGACGSASVATFDLTAPTQFPRAAGQPRGQLLVGEPASLAVLESEKIVVRPAQGAVTHLGNAQWSDRLPKLLQARIVQAFENAHRLRSVGRPGDRISGDYQLVTDLRAFQIVFVDGKAMADVEISAKVVSDRTGRIVSGRVFKARVPADQAEGPGAAQALDAAFGHVAVDIVLWASRLV